MSEHHDSQDMRSLAMPLQTTPARAGSTWLARYAVNAAGDSCDFAIVVLPPELMDMHM